MDFAPRGSNTAVSTTFASRGANCWSAPKPATAASATATESPPMVSTVLENARALPSEARSSARISPIGRSTMFVFESD